MKKRLSLLLLVTLVASFLSGCSKSEVIMEFSQYQAQRSFGLIDEEAIEKVKTENGVKSVKEREDGGLDIVMDKKIHEDLVKGLESELNDIIKYTESASEYMFIKSIDIDEGYENMNIVIDEGELEIFKVKNKTDQALEGMALSLGSMVVTFKAYAVKGSSININYVDSETKENIKTIVFPEYFEEEIKNKK